VLDALRTIQLKKGVWIPGGLLLAASALFTWPGVVYSVVKSHDLISHIVWQTQFSRQFWMGDLYPRWLVDVHAGLGSPVFFFYGPLPYFFGSAIDPLFHSLLDPLQRIGLSAAFSIFFSGIGTYCWLKGALSKRNALLGALIYMAIPYHLYVNYYVRFAYAELWAMAIVPFVFWCADRIVKNKPLAISGFSLTYAFLIMSHLPTTLLASPFLIVFSLVFAEPGQRMKTLTRLSAAMVIGIGLSAVYFIPAMSLQQFIHINVMSANEYGFDSNFLFNFYNNRTNFNYHLTFMTIWTVHGFVLWIAALAISLWRYRDKKRREVLFWSVAGLTALFMMLPASRMLWELIPVLKKVQFPWRFHTIFSLSVLMLLIHALRAMGRTGLWSGWLPRVPAPALMVVLLLPFILNAAMHPGNPLPVSTSGIDARLAQGIRLLAGAPEYVPIYSSTHLISLKTPSMPRTYVLSGSGAVSIEAWAPRKIVLDIQADSDLELQLKQYYFPGWQTHTLDRPGALNTFPIEKSGLLGVSIPKGRSRVAITLEMNGPEKVGWIVSGITLLFWLGITAYGFASRHRKRAVPANRGDSPSPV